MLVSMSGPFSRCNDEPPTIPPMPRYLDVGVDARVPPDMPRADSRPTDQKIPDVLRSREASAPDVWPLGEMKVPDALHTH